MPLFHSSGKLRWMATRNTETVPLFTGLIWFFYKQKCMPLEIFERYDKKIYIVGALRDIITACILCGSFWVLTKYKVAAYYSLQKQIAPPQKSEEIITLLWNLLY